MTGSIPSLSEYDEEPIAGRAHGTLDYAIPDNGQALRHPSWWRRQGRVCNYPHCDKVITDKARYCRPHREAGKRARAQVERLMEWKAKREMERGQE